MGLAIVAILVASLCPPIHADPNSPATQPADPDGDEGFVAPAPLTLGNATRIVFVCDASGSMLSVFGKIKLQLKELISYQNANQKFNVIFYHDGSVDLLFNDSLHPSDAVSKKAAIDFIDNEVSSGTSNLLPAVRAARSQKPDLLVLINDGFDEITNDDDLVAAFGKKKDDLKMQVDCVFLQSDDDDKAKRDKKVLEKITSDHHGTLKIASKADM